MQVYPVMNISTPRIRQTNNLTKSESQPSFTRNSSLTRLIYSRFDTAFLRDNKRCNNLWSSFVDMVFKNGDTNFFLNYVNNKSVLKPLFPATGAGKVQNLSRANIDASEFPLESATLRSVMGNLAVTVDKSGHIQIKNPDLGGNLFVERTDLDKVKGMDEVGKDIIANGVRGFDPHSQDDWHKTPMGTGWPTSPDTRAKEGVAKLSFDKSKRAIIMDTPETVGEGYETHPRAFTILDDKNNSVVFAFQQENHSHQADFGAWSVLPFKFRPGKKTLTIFPIEERTVQRFENKLGDDMKELHASGQWDIDASKRFLTVDASKPCPKSEYMDPDADWSIIATEGDEHICLLRSCYKDSTPEKQFKVYSGDQDNGGMHYIENEFIGPRVPKGKKSTLVYRADFVSLNELGLPKLTKDNMSDVLKEAAAMVQERIDKIKNA